MKLFNVEYLSSCTVNKRLTNPMIPWIIAEIKKNNNKKKVNILYLYKLHIKVVIDNYCN